MQIRIYYEDTDAGGVVYHTNYIKYCERARSEYFFKKALKPIINGAHFVVRKIDCDFLASAFFADIVTVKTTIKEIKKVSLVLLQEIYKDEKLIFKATITLVLAKDGKPKRIDQNIKDMLQSLFDKIVK
jgi:acyl-CoA thioester hydrolase